MSLLDQINDYVWGRIDENEYLQKVVRENSIDSDLFLSKVKAIQADLNIQLRKGVEENHSRLLEQVGAIESLDAMQTAFDDEMRVVNEKAEKISRIYNDCYEQVKTDSLSLEQLTELSRVLNDGIRCKQLVERWDRESDLLARSECVNELKLLCADNPTFSSIAWMKDGFLKQVPDIVAKTSKMAIEELKIALVSLNVTYVNSCLKALHYLFDSDGCNQKIKVIIDDAIKEVDSLFLNLSVATSSDRAAKQLPQLGNKLHTFLEQFQLLGIENAQKFANGVASIMRHRMPSSPEYSIRLVQTITKCLLPHPDVVSKPIRDALGPLKATLLSQSLESLQELVEDTFTHDDKKAIVIIEKINDAIKAELLNVNWDPELQKQVEGNIAKVFQIIGNKIEFQLSFTPETLQLTGRVTKAQSSNYQLLSIAHAFRRQWPLFSDSLRQVIDPHLKLIIDTMKATVALVLESMNEEFQKGISQQNQVSLFMRELCDHLKVFRTHVSQIAPLAESLEALPNFINHVIEQYLLHISLIRPLSAATAQRFTNDLAMLCKSLQGFNCKSSKYLNTHKQLEETLQSLPEIKDTHLRNIPRWLPIHFLISASPSILCLPHESADWSSKEYVQWFSENSNQERYQFLQNLVASFEQSTDNPSQVPNLPKIKALLQKELVSRS